MMWYWFIIVVVVITLLLCVSITREKFAIDQLYPGYTYNPYRDINSLFYDKVKFRKPETHKFSKSRYFAIYQDIKPDLGMFTTFDVKNITLTNALNLLVLRNDYSMISYDNKKNLAYFYPFASYATGTPVNLKVVKNFDTYIKI